MLSANVEMLIHLLAQTDALFVPFRFQAIGYDRTAVAIGERRTEYRRLGLQFTGGGGATQRQAFSRSLGAAAQQNLITVAGGPAPRVRLADSCARALRGLLALPQIEDAWDLQRTIAALTDCGFENASYVCETDILGLDYGKVTSRDLVGLENRLSPLLVDGLLESASDGEGRVGFRITSMGRLALKSGLPVTFESDLPPFDQGAADTYDNFFKAELAARNSWQPISTQEVFIPLSCGLWPDVPSRFRRLDDPGTIGTSAAEGTDG